MSIDLAEDVKSSIKYGMPQDLYPDLAPFLTRSAHKHTLTGLPEQVCDKVSNEVPVALVFNGISHAVMMATPEDLEVFALGFALSEGILLSPDECFGIDVIAIDAQLATKGLTAAYEVRVEISSRRFAKLKEHRRSLSGRTGCGVCGVESLASFDLNAPKVTRPVWLETLDFHPLMNAFEQLPKTQKINQHTGSVHAAAWVLSDGNVVKTMEDVGRHNALDKLLGWRAKEGLHTDQNGFVIMTSRASYELIRKCAFLNVPVLATISAPTALAISLATHANIRLYGLCRQQRVMQYND